MASPARSIKVSRPARPGSSDVGALIVNLQLGRGLDVEPILLRSVLEKTLKSFEEVRHRHSGTLSEDELIREVGATLVDNASAATQTPAIAEGWQELLERGLRSKRALLESTEFKSTAQVSQLLAIGEPAVRKRIREGRLFAVTLGGDGDYRSPAWALDPQVSKVLQTVLAGVDTTDAWRIYHFMTTPHGGLHGLRPFECLMSNESLPASTQSVREELRQYLGLAAQASLVDAVRQALDEELKEGSAA